MLIQKYGIYPQKRTDKRVYWMLKIPQNNFM
jgi:hypothetical protein